MEEGLEGLALRRTRAVLRAHPVDHPAVGGAGVERAEEGRVGEQAGSEGVVPAVVGGVDAGTVDGGEVVGEGDAGIVPVGAGGEAGEVKDSGSPDVAAARSGQARRSGPIVGQVRGPGTAGWMTTVLVMSRNVDTNPVGLPGEQIVRRSPNSLPLVVGVGILGGIVAVLLVASSLVCRILGVGALVVILVGAVGLLRLAAGLRCRQGRRGRGQSRGRRLGGRRGGRLGVAAVALPAGGDDVLPPLALGAVQARTDGMVDGGVLPIVLAGAGTAALVLLLPLLLLLGRCRRIAIGIGVGIGIEIGIATASAGTGRRHVELGPEEGGHLGRGAAARAAELVDLGGAGRPADAAGAAAGGQGAAAFAVAVAVGGGSSSSIRARARRGGTGRRCSSSSSSGVAGRGRVLGVVVVAAAVVVGGANQGDPAAVDALGHADRPESSGGGTTGTAAVAVGRRAQVPPVAEGQGLGGDGRLPVAAVASVADTTTPSGGGGGTLVLVLIVVGVRQLPPLQVGTTGVGVGGALALVRALAVALPRAVR
mmetsp:Transcript_29159/g.84783  ORF Transcript_29159/g.84783 Transcript_29159/m.84783 type:complete len:537 (-) Transcript_29159:512-2122(-)